MNKKYLLAVVGMAGAIGAGVYFREELKEFYLSERAALKSEKPAVVETIPETTPRAAVKPEVYFFLNTHE